MKKHVGSDKISTILYRKICKITASNYRCRKLLLALISKIRLVTKAYESAAQSCYINNRLKSIIDIEHDNLLPNCIEEEKYAHYPSSLFKYFGNTTTSDKKKNLRNYSIEALLTNKVFMANPIMFNDPYDSYAFIDKRYFAKTRLEYYLSKTSTTFLKEDNNNDLINKLATILEKHFKNVEPTTKLMSSLIESIPSLFNLDMTNKREKNKLWLFLEYLKPCISYNLLKLKEKNFFVDAVNYALKQDYNHTTDRFNCKISCFSSKLSSLLMWAHYANNHKGFCVEYDLTNKVKNIELLSKLHPVIYCNRIGNLTEESLIMDANLPEEAKINMFNKKLLRKSTDWKYENEWRMIIQPSPDNPTEHYEFFPIKRVFLGCKMPVKDKQDIIAICKKRGIEYHGMIIKKEKYEMEICDRLCENCSSLQ